MDNKKNEDIRDDIDGGQTGNASGFTYEEILGIIEKISDSNIDEFRINTELSTIDIKKNRRMILDSTSAGVMPSYPQPIQTPAAPLQAQAPSENVSGQQAAGTANADVDGVYVVKSPIVGTFYSSKEEGGAPLVKVGDSVKKDSIVAIVEAMKLMNEITAGADGVILEILVENGQMVEYGQELMKIKF